MSLGSNCVTMMNAKIFFSFILFSFFAPPSPAWTLTGWKYRQIAAGSSVRQRLASSFVGTNEDLQGEKHCPT
jgi:hypothetical protein